MARSPLADRAVLVAPAPFGAELRAPVVAAAIGRGLEAAGLRPPDLCPLAGGGAGTIEVLLPALGGETAEGFVLVEDGGAGPRSCCPRWAARRPTASCSSRTAGRRSSSRPTTPARRPSGCGPPPPP